MVRVIAFDFEFWSSLSPHDINNKGRIKTNENAFLRALLFPIKLLFIFMYLNQTYQSVNFIIDIYTAHNNNMFILSSNNNPAHVKESILPPGIPFVAINIKGFGRQEISVTLQYHGCNKDVFLFLNLPPLTFLINFLKIS